MQIETWQELLLRSNGMTTPTVISGAFCPEEIENFTQLYSDIFREFIRRGAGHLGLKVFAGSEPSREYHNRVMGEPPAEGESLSDWTTRLFGEERFGIALNNLEKYSHEFAAAVARQTNPLLELTGIPLGGMAFLLFVGNYGFTPFGVHKDNPGEEGFLFHMGPGEKRLYTWETKHFLELSGGEATHKHPEEILSEAEYTFTLAPGDIAFIPSSAYHVADTPNFSISMVMDFVTPPAHRVRQAIATHIVETNKGLGYADPVPPLVSVDNGYASVLEQLDMGSEITRGFEDYLLRLQSNCGFYTPAEGISEGGAIIPGEGEKLKIADPFPIFYRRRDEENVTIYCRGNPISILFHPQLTDWIDRLNAGEEFSWEEVLKVFEPEWDLRRILELLSGLGHCGGIKNQSIVIESEEQGY
ncbi:MAG: hypothetical protein KDD67_10865 [Ignavibacteriae bacterium]|nr:hypothetical protein [Ignavibacteriota bacterium]